MVLRPESFDVGASGVIMAHVAVVGESRVGRTRGGSMERQGSILVDLGIAESDRQAIAYGLERLLADSYTLYLKTQNYHWNVTGPMFSTLHVMFEAHYTELAIAVDVIAERIRSLGAFAPGSFAAFARLSSVEESDSVPHSKEMVRQLLSGHEQVARTARGVFTLVDAAGDQATADLLTQRLQVHEKTAWMLRSLIDTAD
jgi:starvation-inducible DNA-binding protein